ncbi:MAG: hypothetical protein H5T86_16295, partial [Armatimonadetes bacterium]|nr:hypothetical protein [Armatimonadota bacterium]
MAVDCAAIREAVSSLRDQAVLWLMDLIRFPSTQGNEAEVQAYVLKTLH